MFLQSSPRSHAIWAQPKKLLDVGRWGWPQNAVLFLQPNLAIAAVLVKHVPQELQTSLSFFLFQTIGGPKIFTAALFPYLSFYSHLHPPAQLLLQITRSWKHFDLQTPTSPSLPAWDLFPSSAFLSFLFIINSFLYFFTFFLAEINVC